MASFEDHYQETVIPAINRHFCKEEERGKVMQLGKKTYEAARDGSIVVRQGRGHRSIYSCYYTLAEDEGWTIKRQGRNMSFMTALVRYIVDTAKMAEPNLQGLDEYPNEKAREELVDKFELLPEDAEPRRKRPRNSGTDSAPKKYRRPNRRFKLAIDVHPAVPATGCSQSGPQPPHGSLPAASPAPQSAMPPSTMAPAPPSAESSEDSGRYDIESDVAAVDNTEADRENPSLEDLDSDEGWLDEFLYDP